MARLFDVYLMPPYDDLKATFVNYNILKVKTHIF